MTTKKITPIPELAVNPFIFEVLELVTKQRTIATADKIGRASCRERV